MTTGSATGHGIEEFPAARSAPNRASGAPTSLSKSCLRGLFGGGPIHGMRTPVCSSNVLRHDRANKTAPETDTATPIEIVHGEPLSTKNAIRPTNATKP
ncbi:hypothetical protein [Rhodococcus sp. P1Y]|uniref:hypothetical protein n=1 Tax=Rhodococcus sp. P1Y TaxID=1302308 RepID=UPI00129323CC|nr:hypothetical protein [Rhodococcus sp. P1Y]